MSARKARAAALAKLAHPRRSIIARLRGWITPTKSNLRWLCPEHASKIVFLSGESMPLKLDANDRRFMVLTDEVQP